MGKEFEIPYTAQGLVDKLNAVKDETQIKQIVAGYLQENPIDGVDDEDVREAISDYLTENPVDTLTEEEVTSIVTRYLEENPVSGVTDEAIASAVSSYIAQNPINGLSETEQAKLDMLQTDGDKGYFLNQKGVYVDVEKDVVKEFAEDNTSWGANLPVIFIEGDLTGISKENTVNVTVRYASQFKDFTDTATLKWQGTSSLTYPKKNFTVKFTNKHGFGWGKSKKWVLKANYVDHTHARNIVGAKIWAQIVKSRPDFDTNPTMQLLNDTPNMGAVDGYPVRVYVNGIYEGIYTFNVGKNAFMFNMDNTNPNHNILSSEDYVGGCFHATNVGWEDECHDVMPQTTQNRWNEIITFVKDSTDANFKAHLGEYLDVQSVIDYYIYHYVNAGLDGFGKNQIFYSYDNVIYFASSYDMDSIWGSYWNGDIISPEYPYSSYECYVNGRQGNKLYERLAVLFKDEILERYLELRSTVLSASNILAEFEKFMSRITTEQYAEDLVLYPNIPKGGTISQLRNYIPARLAYVDTKFIKYNVTEITVNQATLYENKTARVTCSLAPANANDYQLTYSVDDTSVATVDENGVITGVAQGTATITVTDTKTNVTGSATITVLEAIETEDDDIAGNLLYNLAEETVLTGAQCIDTNVTLMETDKDWTVFVEFDAPTPDTATSYGQTLVSCMVETAPYNGFVIRNNANVMGIAVGQNSQIDITGLSTTQTEKRRLVITHTVNSSDIEIYTDSGAHITGTGFAVHEGHLIIGAAYKTGTTLGQRYFNGTIYKAKIWDAVATTDERIELLGIAKATAITIQDFTVTSGRKKNVVPYITTTPNDAYCSLTYTSANTEVATIERVNGVEYIKGVSTGTVTITATDRRTNISTTFDVTVEADNTTQILATYPELGEMYYDNDELVEAYPYIMYHLDNTSENRVLWLFKDEPYKLGIGNIDWNTRLVYQLSEQVHNQGYIVNRNTYTISNETINTTSETWRNTYINGENYLTSIISNGVNDLSQVANKIFLSSFDVYQCEFDSTNNVMVYSDLLFSKNV